VLQLWNKAKGEDFTGTNLQKPAAGLEAYTTQIRPTIRDVTHVAPKSDSIPRKSAIPSLYGKPTSNTHSEIQG